MPLTAGFEFLYNRKTDPCVRNLFEVFPAVESVCELDPGDLSPRPGNGKIV